MAQHLRKPVALLSCDWLHLVNMAPPSTEVWLRHCQ